MTYSKNPEKKRDSLKCTPKSTSVPLSVMDTSIICTPLYYEHLCNSVIYAPLFQTCVMWTPLYYRQLYNMNISLLQTSVMWAPFLTDTTVICYRLFCNMGNPLLQASVICISLYYGHLYYGRLSLSITCPTSCNSYLNNTNISVTRTYRSSLWCLYLKRRYDFLFLN